VSSLRSRREDDEKAENFTDEGLNFPSVNELRYAGHHFLLAISSIEQKKQAENFQQAANHAKRAVYDACEEILLYCNQAIRKFDKDYATVIVADIVPNYFEIKATADKASELLEEGRAAYEEREQFFEVAERHVDVSIENVKMLQNSRSELNKKLRDEKKKTWSIMIMLATLLLAVVALIIQG
jgi:hypothetical protein